MKWNIRNLDLRNFLLEKISLISETDTRGNITYINDNFCKISGYSRDELLGNTHRLITSNHHSKEFWKNMFKTASKPGNIWTDTVINKTKDGDLYYVFSWVVGIFNAESKLTGYLSIRQDITKLIKQQKYLDYATKIIRHDMYSGINIYMPRGISSIKRKIPEDIIVKYGLQPSLQLLTAGLSHTQNVYDGVYQFTNYIRHNDKPIKKVKQDLTTLLTDFFKLTSYYDNIKITPLPEVTVCSGLFCTAIDNIVRNGLKYNDSQRKMIKIFYDEPTNSICIEDNGRGLSNYEFNKFKHSYSRKKNQKESGSGLGLHICSTIMNEHKFKFDCYKIKTGTVFTIGLV